MNSTSHVKQCYWVKVRFTSGKTDDLMYEAYSAEGAIAACKREVPGVVVLGVAAVD